MTQEVFEQIKAGLEEAIETTKADQSSTGETAFTPGPWRCTKKHPRQICDWRGFKIAKCLMETKGANFKISEDEALANAHLTAAAPELYEALSPAVDELSEVLADLKKHGDGVDFVQQDISRLERIVGASKAALSKARGEDL